MMPMMTAPSTANPIPNAVKFFPRGTDVSGFPVMPSNDRDGDGVALVPFVGDAVLGVPMGGGDLVGVAVLYAVAVDATLAV